VAGANSPEATVNPLLWIRQGVEWVGAITSRISLVTWRRTTVRWGGGAGTMALSRLLLPSSLRHRRQSAIPTHTRTHVHTYTHTRTHTHTYTHTHTHIHTHTHVRSQLQ